MTNETNNPSNKEEEEHQPSLESSSSPPWMPDSTSIRCNCCQLIFNKWNIFNHNQRRKHHCRFCGQIFCHNCSNQRCLIPPSCIVLNSTDLDHNTNNNNNNKNVVNNDSVLAMNQNGDYNNIQYSSYSVGNNYDHDDTNLSMTPSDSDSDTEHEHKHDKESSTNNDNYYQNNKIHQHSQQSTTNINTNTTIINHKHHHPTLLLYGKSLSTERLLLARHPLRVCHSCYDYLQPIQEELRFCNSNAMRYNTIHYQSNTCRRMLNSPLAFTLGHEIRKAAYTLYNLLPIASFGKSSSNIHSLEYRHRHEAKQYHPDIQRNSKNANAYTRQHDYFRLGSDEYMPFNNLQDMHYDQNDNHNHNNNNINNDNNIPECCCPTTCLLSLISSNCGSIDGIHIPAPFIHRARGIAILTMVKGGFGFSGIEFGTGLLMKRLFPPSSLSLQQQQRQKQQSKQKQPYNNYNSIKGYENNNDNSDDDNDQDGHNYYSSLLSSNDDVSVWSPPCAIGCFGVSLGALVGVQLCDVVLLLMTDEAVDILANSKGSIRLGVDVGVAIGPIGRNLEVDIGVAASSTSTTTSTDGYSIEKYNDTNDCSHLNQQPIQCAPIYSYGLSKGIFAGLSLDGKAIMIRHYVNEKFYGYKVDPNAVLNGEIPSPPAAQPLYDILRRFQMY